MELFHSIAEAQGRLPGCAVTIGNFDGVHLGHRRLIERTRELAAARGSPSVLLTFEPHPARVLSPQSAPPLICTFERKLALLRETGLDAVVTQRFDRAYAASSPADFARRDLLGGLGCRDVVVGHDFTFGKGRAGNPEVLSELLAGEATVHTVEAVERLGEVVSSSRIRRLLAAGEVEVAAELLSRPFVFDGEIVRGEGRGKGLGFPTANLAPATELLPGDGVYAVLAAVEGLPHVMGGAANVGVKPTFGVNERGVEVYLFDLDANLYGRKMTISFLARLRPELRFPSVEALVARMEEDVARARQIVDAWQGPQPSLP